MLDCYNLLKETRGTNDKLAILKTYLFNHKVKEALRLCYDPFIHTFLQNIPKPKTHGTHNFYDQFENFVVLFNRLDEREVTGNAARNEVRSFLEWCDSDTQDLFIRLFKKDLKVGIAEKTLNKAFGDGFVNIFEVQLGEPYDPLRSYRVEKGTYGDLDFWFCSRKMNGIRGYQEGDDVLRTRHGNKIYGFDHILEEINRFKQEYGLYFVDGELFEFGIPFQTIASYVSAEVNIVREDKEKIRFNVFAVGKRSPWRHTGQMVECLSLVDWSRYRYLKYVPYERVKNQPEAIYSVMNRYAEEGFEGAMLRHPIRCWSKGRSHDLVKVKPVKEGDFRVIGFEAGKPDGESANSLGALIITGVYKETIKGVEVSYPIRSECGSGFKKKSEEGVTRDEIWKNQSEWLDTIVEIHFQSITDKPDADGYYALNFARFYRKRVDKKL